MRQINSGELKSVITIQQPAQSQDSYKDVMTAFSDYYTTRAKVEPASGSEKIVASHLQAEVSHKVTLRQSSTHPITPAMRVSLGGRLLNIVSVLQDESDHRVLTLYCLEVPAV